jgi:predicted dehydrogenase
MSSVRVASIGLGWWGKELARAARTAGIELATCFARTPEKRAEFAAEFGCPQASTLDEVLEDDSVDGLLIATSHASHRGLVERAAESGKHIFIEKPLAYRSRTPRHVWRAPGMPVSSSRSAFSGDACPHIAN